MMGFSKILLDDHGGALDEEARGHLARVVGAAERMGLLIDGLLDLSRLTRKELVRQSIDISQTANEIATALQVGQPERRAEFSVAQGVVVQGDPVLLKQVLANLIGNAWKYTAKSPDPAKIEFGALSNGDGLAYFVRDNGAGFDMRFADKLFGVFQRLHSAQEFEGTGIGLATVQRIIHRHGGRVWAEGAPGKGAAFYFTLT